MQRPRATRPPEGDRSLHAPLLLAAADAAVDAGPGSEAVEDTRLSAVPASLDPLRNRLLPITCRALPPCLWASCIVALSMLTQDLCHRPLFNGQITTRYATGTIDALATILNLLAGSSVLFTATVLLSAVASCFSSTVAKYSL